MKYEAASRAKSKENLENAGHCGIISPCLRSGAIEIFIRDVRGTGTGAGETSWKTNRSALLDRPAGPFGWHNHGCDSTHEILNHASDSVMRSGEEV